MGKTKVKKPHPKATNRTVITVGAVVIGLALLIILSSVIVPRIGGKMQFQKQLKLFLKEEAMRVILRDPMAPNGGILGDTGKEALLTPEQKETVLLELRALEEKGFRLSSQEKRPAGTLDLSLTVRTAKGDIGTLYFLEDQVYCHKNGAAHFFTPKDGEAYAAFFALLKSCLP